MTNGQIEAMRDWAKEKLRAGQEPPWAWYRYMQLVDCLDAILAGRQVVRLATENGEPVSVEPTMPV